MTGSESPREPKEGAEPAEPARPAGAPVTGTITGLIPPEWFTRPEDSSIWLRIYTCLFAPLPHLTESMLKWPGVSAGVSLKLGAPTAMAWGTVSGFNLQLKNIDIYSKTTGQVVLDLHLAEKVLPDAIYAFVATPFRTDGAAGDEATAKERLNLLAAIVCTHAGQNIMRGCVFEGELAAAGGTITSSSAPSKMPQLSEGPFLAAQNGADIFEVAACVSDTAEPLRGRLQLALRLVESAMRRDQGFLEYWTALEVVCDGKSGRILDRFRSIYGLLSHKEAAELSGLGVLTKWRGAFVHRGREPHLTADIERYLQLIFLDLLRFELGLESRLHAGSMQQAKGYDLSSLGLRDNRTEEQKAAAKAAEQIPPES